MDINRMMSNQWSVGAGLRRCTIYSKNRWMLWINHGYGTWSLGWNRNPARTEQTP